MTEELTVAMTWRDLPAAAQAVLRETGCLYTSAAWLAVEEIAHPGDHRYLSATSGGAVAVAAAYRFDETNNPWPAARPDLFVAEQTGRHDARLAQLLPSWVLGGRRPGHTHVPASGAQQQRRDALTRLLAGAAQGAADAGAATLAALYCPSADTDLTEAFAAQGGVRLPAPGLNTLRLPAGGWESWLAKLSRKRRNAELADARKLADAGVRLRVQPLTPADVEKIVPLELSLYTKYGHDYRADEARRLHLAYLAHLRDDALIVRAERDGQMVGFVSVIRSGTTAYLRQAGFDARGCEGTPVYFGTVFHEPVRWAATTGVRALDLSTSMDEVKQRRGAVTSEREAWVVPLTSAVAKALRATVASPPA